MLNIYNCKLEDAIIVTDRGSNMVAAFKQFRHIYCIDQLLNNVIEKGIKEVDEISELCNLSSKLVEYFKISGENSKLNSSLKSFCPSRWNTMFYLLESIENNWLEIRKFLKVKNELQRIENINLSYVKGIVKALKPFEQASKIFEEEKYATLPLVYVYINGLIENCIAESDDMDVIKRFKYIIREHLETTVMSNLTILHKIALFLFPPANKLIQFNEVEKATLKSECAALLQTYLENNDEGTSSQPSSSSNKIMIPSYFKNFVISASNINSKDKISAEIEAYQNMNIPFEENFDAINWWHLHQLQFSLLYKLSCKILATPAFSASSERVFSKARQLLSEKRTNITSNSRTLNQIIFLNFNTDKIVSKSDVIV